MAKEGSVRKDEHYLPDHRRRRVPSLEKIRRLIGWERRYTLEETLAAVKETLAKNPGLGGR